MIVVYQLILIEHPLNISQCVTIHGPYIRIILSKHSIFTWYISYYCHQRPNWRTPPITFVLALSQTGWTHSSPFCRQDPCHLMSVLPARNPQYDYSSSPHAQHVDTTHTHACMHARARTHTHTHVHVHIHVYTHTHTHTHTYTQVHAHTHTVHRHLPVDNLRFVCIPWSFNK